MKGQPVKVKYRERILILNMSLLIGFSLVFLISPSGSLSAIDYTGNNEVDRIVAELVSIIKVRQEKWSESDQERARKTGELFSYQFPSITPDSEDEAPFAVPPTDPRYFQPVDPRVGDEATSFAENHRKRLKNAEQDTMKHHKFINVMDHHAETQANLPKHYPESYSSAEGDDYRDSETVLKPPVTNELNKKTSKFAKDTDSLSQKSEKHSEDDVKIESASSFFPFSVIEVEKLKGCTLGVEELTNFYLLVMIAGCGTAAILTFIIIGWYRLQQKRVKAAADVDYPAYGVTGPHKEVSPTGDRRLAHSAQMYHYQHQKQQIIAMENGRTCNEARRGSVSEAESDEEGDYTVYECPGLAVAGEMEVKNPLFNDEPTPGAPISKSDDATTQINETQKSN